MSFRPIILACTLVLFGSLNAQVSVPNNQGNSGDFVGWDNTLTNNFPLEIRHDLNQPIEWYTDAVQRMVLRETLTGQTVNTYGPVDLTGHLGVGIATTRPLTYLHLNRTFGSPDPTGYRPWMRTGLLAQDSALVMTYIGVRRPSGGPRSSILAWSQILGDPDWPTHFSFTFTSNPNIPVGMAGTLNGLEIARMLPDPNGNEGYFGIGDFATAVDNPTERLDVLDGDVRIRELPDASNEAVDEYKVMVVDDSNDPDEIGIVKWVDPADLSADCEWTMNVTSPNHVYTALGGVDPDCPDDFEAVGIGMDPVTVTTGAANPVLAKLNVFNRGLSGEFTDPNGTSIPSRTAGFFHSNSSSNMNIGSYSLVDAYSIRSRSVLGISNGTTELAAYGGDFRVYDNAFYTNGVTGFVTKGQTEANGATGTTWSEAKYNHGVYGISHGKAIPASGIPGSTNPTSRHYGVRGHATSQLEGQWAFGVYGEAIPQPWVTPTPLTSHSWAGYFVGDAYVSGRGWIGSGPWQTSDEQLKTGIENIQGASELLSQLEPKTYTFIPQEHPHLQLPTELQYGLLAQELEQVLPTLVGSKSIPAEIDSLGNVIHAEVTHKGINYTALIPILIAAHKEQQVLVDEQQAQIEALTDQAAANQAATDELEELRNRMDQLEQLLAACCQNPADPRNQQIDGTGGTEENEHILRIQPNPFDEQTTIYYQLERSGRMQLMANSSDGKQLRILEEAQREAGSYQYEWFTNDLAPGIYYVTLLLDGEPVVKKAVKVR